MCEPPALDVREAPGGAILAVRVVPRAGRTVIAGVREGAVLVRLAAAPVDGAANDALVDLLAKTLRVGRTAVGIISGERARLKRVQISGLPAAEVADRLRGVLTGGHRRTGG